MLALVGVGLERVYWPLFVIVIPVLIWLFAFFRDPERPVPVDENTLVSPADGTVSDIMEIDNEPLLGEPAVRVGIFLSVFNVHVNRSPCDAKVLRKAERGRESLHRGSFHFALGRPRGRRVDCNCNARAVCACRRSSPKGRPRRDPGLQRVLLFLPLRGNVSVLEAIPSAKSTAF
ncbi:MAG TPA: phosphatidylserine decarboxylase [Tepidisphaeraceae bacterium]|nr:phosphatidylserine decarboxylase [Tepidisphaeraceae bacterium]